MPEVLIILVVLVLVFGANKIPQLPQLGDALGKGIRNFKKAAGKGDDSIDVTPKDQSSQKGQLPHGAATTATPSSSPAVEKKA